MTNQIALPHKLPDDLIAPAADILEPAALCAALDSARVAHPDDKAFRKAAITLLQEAQSQGRDRIAVGMRRHLAAPIPPDSAEGEITGIGVRWAEVGSRQVERCAHEAVR